MALDMMMLIDYGIVRLIESDLGLNVQVVKGQDIPVRNCWHFSTDGNLVDFLFCDEADFVAATNRIFILAKRYHIVVLAYSLMDTHVHFVLWGDFKECKRFMHEYLRLTSRYIALKYGDRHKLENVFPEYQTIDTDWYLKICICYTLKNAPEGGIPFNAWDYPWSSGPLYFRRKGYWSSPDWDTMLTDSLSLMPTRLRQILRTRKSPGSSFKLIGGMVFPGEFIAVDIVERVFRTHKSFSYFMSKTKKTDVESVKFSASLLSIPNSELNQHKREFCREMFGVDTIRSLSTDQRLTLARKLRFSYNCSPKQIAKVCGLKYDEVKSML